MNKIIYKFLSFVTLFSLPIFNCCQQEDSVLEEKEYTPLHVVDSIEKIQKLGLPVVIISSKQEFTKEYSAAELKINDTCINNVFEKKDIKIKLRGNSSLEFPKKSYTLQFEEKQSLLQMREDKKWTLIANYPDMSFLKNEIASFISDQLNAKYTMHSKYCNVILNGTYIGLYQLFETPHSSKNRINLNDTNQFLLEYDVNYDEHWKFKSELNYPVMIKNDKYMDSTAFNLIKSKLQDTEKKIKREIFSTIDIQSFALFNFIQNIMFNTETCWPKSVFLILDISNNMLSCGPVWDFDWSLEHTMENLDNNIIQTPYSKFLQNNEDFIRFSQEYCYSISENDIVNHINETTQAIEKSAILDYSIYPGTHQHNIFYNDESFAINVENVTSDLIKRLILLKNFYAK